MTIAVGAEAPLVVPLEALPPGDLGIGGGKASSLGELMRRGHRVPPGFCVTTRAYRTVAGLAGLEDILAARLADPPERLAEAARAALASVAMPGDVASAIVAAYGSLG